MTALITNQDQHRLSLLIIGCVVVLFVGTVAAGRGRR